MNVPLRCDVTILQNAVSFALKNIDFFLNRLRKKRAGRDPEEVVMVGDEEGVLGVGERWSRLPAGAVGSPSQDIFKSGLQRHGWVGLGRADVALSRGLD